MGHHSPQRISKRHNLTNELSSTPINSNSQNVVKEKLLRDCGYNLFDPRSPNQLIVRTPMEFKHYKVTSNTNDSIASLEYTEEFNGMNSFESALSAACNEIMGEYNERNEDMKLKENTIEIARYKKNETTFLETDFDYVKDVLQTPMFQHIKNKVDPRSPTVGVERTPIVFSDAENLEIPFDDKESNEGIVELVPEAIVNTAIKIQEPDPKKKILRKIKPQKVDNIKQIIYEDGENISLSTPKKSNSDNNSVGVRTPLSCVANTKHMRSKLAFESKSVTPFISNATPNGKSSKIPIITNN